MIYLVAVAWLYVVFMMAAAEAVSPNGTLLGAVFTLLLYGVLPLAITLYLLATPQRRRRRREREAAQAEAAARESAALQPDGGGHAAGDAVATKREEA